jgi:hypothetical protein
MSAQKLAFLENFYTDVTLYIPAEKEPAVADVLPLSAVKVAAASPAVAAVALAPATPAASATPKPAPATAPPAPELPSRKPTQPSMAFSRPSAGLERLAAGELVPAAETPAPAAPMPLRAAPVLPAPPAAPAPSPVLLTPFSTLGSNAQGVILLFRLSPEQFQRMHRNVFLNKMLQALNYVMADVVLVNVESELPVALVNLRRELAATHIIAFGKNLLDVSIRNTQIYEPVQFPNLGMSYLASATVDLVEYDVSLKKRLWPGLQRMFLG